MKTELFILIVLTIMLNANAQQTKGGTFRNKYSISTSLWSLSNFGDEPADFYELNIGCRLDSKQNLQLNATTWKYWEPLGISYGRPDRYAHTEEYPGYVKAWGLGIIYQRFVWKQFYAAVHANTFLQNIYNVQHAKIQSGFQLYLQFRVGNRWEFLQERFFLEPALSLDYWPVKSNLHNESQQVEETWPNYFLFEPHLNFGVNF